MAKRFGRNQKRRMREQIAAAESRLAAQEREAGMLRRRLVDARSDALEEYASRHALLKSAIDKIAHHLGHALGDQMMPHAEKLMAASVRRDRMPLRLHMHEAYREEKVTIIEGEIPALHYRVAVLP